MQFNKTYVIAFLLTVFTGLTASAQLGDTSQKKTFNLTIAKDGKQIVMACRSGCAWETLSFESPRRGLSVTVDQFGMKGDRQTASNPDELSEFSFSIAKMRGEYKLIGLEGTAWKTLTFTLPEDDSEATISTGGVRVK
ncbi:hypothetical protein [Gilvibacter sediminis]|uniref:hypothetical protein n=1 Tax=Gilvibacter sediminis TaxID=379071 RepID=UPI00235045A1|nr:hypothetical protein [Gilvibacter sediminis]MDC7997311.1 hypothetical protein [Gilvibacter sediminis]